MKRHLLPTTLLFLASVTLGSALFAAGEPAGPKLDLLAAYVKISAALAADNLADAKSAAAALAGTAGAAKNQAVADQASVVAKAADLAGARGGYKTLSLTIEPLAAGAKGYTVMFCPMANADWVQTSGGTMNPFFGRAMLTCGVPKK